MSAHKLLLGLVMCCFAAVAAAAPNKAQQNCLSGVPCGNLCAPLGGTCIASQCYDSLGYPALCYAPMANTYDSSSWWQPLFAPIAPMFPSFRSPFQPFTAPMQPMQPMAPMQPMGDMFAGFGSCGGNGPCGSGEFCDVTGVCREDTCENQFTFGCPKDTGNLVKVNCIHNSGYNKCYESSTGGFKCYKGPAGGSVACASNGFSSTSASMTANFNFNNNNNNNQGDKQQQQGGTAAATGSSSTGSGSGTTTASGTVGTIGGSAATTTAQNPNGQNPQNNVPKPETPKRDAAAAAAANSTAAAAPTVSTAAVAGAAQQQQQAKRQRRHKAKAAAAAATATEASGTPAKATFLKNGVPTNQHTTVSPNSQASSGLNSGPVAANSAAAASAPGR